MDTPSAKTTPIVVCRWVVFLPAAVLASVVAYYVAWFMVVCSWTYFVDPNWGSFIGCLVRYTVPNAVAGASVVGVAWVVAPSRKKVVVVVVAGLVLFVSGGLAIPSLSAGDSWGLYCLVVTNFGSIGSAVGILQEADITKQDSGDTNR